MLPVISPASPAHTLQPTIAQPAIPAASSPAAAAALDALKPDGIRPRHHKHSKKITHRAKDHAKTNKAAAQALAFPVVPEAKLNVETIFSQIALDGPKPRALKFSPDGSRVTFLKAKADNADVFDLWEFHITDGKKRLLVDSKSLVDVDVPYTKEEQNRRERLRLFDKGILDYTWSANGTALLFPIANRLYYHDLTHGATRCLSDNPAPQTDLKFSPKGSFISFVRDKNLFLIDVKTGKERQLTSDGSGTITNGMAEFIAQEEMHRFDGYWWSENEEYIAFFQVDESPVALVPRFNVVSDGIEVFQQRYPSTGTTNASLKLGFVHIPTGHTNLFSPGEIRDVYFARCNWLPDSKTIALQLQSRSQKLLNLVYVDAAAGEERIVFSEEDPVWINLNNDLTFLKTQPGFISASERNNFKHLYLHDANGKIVKSITTGDWCIDSLKGVDEANGIVYFDGYYDSPLEKHLYSIPLHNDRNVDPKRITGRHGWHETTVSIQNHCYIDTYSDPNTPPQVSLHKLKDGGRICWLEKNELNEHHPYFPYLKSHANVEYGTLKAQDGQTLYYSLVKPPAFDPDKKYPVIVHVYGGPGTRLVKKTWGAGSGKWGQLMASQGYIMFTLDNRGSADRGKAFEAPIQKRLGHAEVNDQKTGVDFLRSLPYVDPERIGVFGWSYGGYMTLMMMMKAPDYFQAGIAVAPVTDWNLYDTHYTERYLGTPQENSQGYTESNVFPYIDGLKGPLMVVHGMSDDNVLFQNSAKLYLALQSKVKSFEMMNYPASMHAIAGNANRRHLYGQCIIPFFERHLAKSSVK